MKTLDLRLSLAALIFSTFVASVIALPTSTPPPEATVRAAPEPVSQNFTIGWPDSNPAGKVTGYKVKHGNTSGSYTVTDDVPGQAPAPPGLKTKAYTNFPLGPEYFVVVAYNSGGFESAPSAELAVNVGEQPLPPGTPVITAGGFTQLNTRAKIGTNNETMIATFTVVGKTKVAVRALGPSLSSGLAPIKSTQIDLRDTNGVLIESNRGWQTGPDAAELTSLGLAPPSDKESALIATVDTGSYNVTVSGAKTGVGQVEVYRLEL